MSEATVANPPAAGITKIEAVRQAMEKLVKDATRADLQAYVKEHFGFEMSLDHITDCKKKIMKRAKGKAPKAATPKAVAAPKAGPAAPTGAAASPKTAAPKPAPKPAIAKAAAPKPAAKKAAAPKPAPMPASKMEIPSGIRLTDIESVKGLVGRVGPDQLRSLVDLLAK